MKTKLIIAIFSTTLAACGSTSPPPVIQYSNISIPELNTHTKSYLGEKLVSQAQGYYADTITLSFMDAYASDIEGGEFYNVPHTLRYESTKDNTVVINNGYGSPISQQNWVKFYKETNEICPSLGNCYTSPQITITHKEKPTFVTKPNSFQQAIEYNGKSGDTLKFTYREFSDNMARQAFNTDFTMDLNDGDTVGYKGAVIKVHNANNNMIEYSVIKNFNKI